MVLGSRAGLVWFYLFISINDGAPLCRLFFFPVAGRESWKEAGLSLSLGQASERSSVSSLELVWNLCFFPPPPPKKGKAGREKLKREEKPPWFQPAFPRIDFPFLMGKMNRNAH